MAGKITKFDRGSLDAIEKELRDVAKKYGLETTACDWKCGAFFAVDFKIHVVVPGAQAAEDAREAADFTKYASSHGVPLEALGQCICFGAKFYTITGFVPGDKRSIRVSRGGKKYRMTPTEAKESWDHWNQTVAQNASLKEAKA